MGESQQPGDRAAATAAPRLGQQGFVVLPRFVDAHFARTLLNVLLIRAFRGEGRGDDQVPTAYSFWGDSTLDAALVTLLPELEAVCGCSLLPTYAYARLYVHGDTLQRHSDREACEVAATIHLGHTGEVQPPPICFAPDTAVHQRPGDAVVYRGQVEHWRDRFAGTHFGQLFVNYVRSAGPYRHLAFDGRRDAFPATVLGARNPRAPQ